MRRGRGRGILACMTDPDEPPADERVLRLLADGYWRTLTAAEDVAAAERLVAAGRLQRMRQARRGFPALYRLPR